MARTVKASIFCAKLHDHVGEKNGYVYAMQGYNYSVSYAKTYENMYGTGKKLGAGYYCVVEQKVDANGKKVYDAKGNPVMIKNYQKGKAAKSLGQFAADCSGYLRWCRRVLTGVDAGYSAQGTYNLCKGRLVGPISTFPKKPGVFLFHWNGSKMSHVGCYVGGGYVIEAMDTSHGIVRSKFRSSWTHWGYAPYIEYDVQADTYIDPPEEQDDGANEDQSGKPDDDKFDKDNVPYLRKGHKGKMVRFLQENLVKRGYSMPGSRKKDGTYDGDFGPETDRVVRRFQKAQKITVDGIVGPITWTKLLGYPCKG